MNNSCFTLRLDTTPPVIDIICENKTDRNTFIDVTFISKEALLANHEVYIIDSNGQKKNYIFEKKDDFTFFSFIDTNDFEYGKVKLYYRFSDIVLNWTHLQFKEITVAAGNEVGCITDSIEQVVKVNNESYEPKIYSDEMLINICSEAFEPKISSCICCMCKVGVKGV